MKSDPTAALPPALARRGGRVPTLSEAAYEHVQMSILRGRLTVGSVVAERNIAEELGISKTPVRQALQMLRREGLLEVGRRRQLIVRGFTARHRAEVLEIRQALEQISVRNAAKEMSVEDIDYLRLLVMRQQRAVQAGRDDEFVDLDEEFHIRLAEGADLPIVAKSIAQLRGFVRIMRLGMTARDAIHAVAEHTAILDAIEARDAEAATKALLAHLRNSSQDAVSA
jgi:GntR family transcriptional regulator, rspAB operon transcriptional repressor